MMEKWRLGGRPENGIQKKVKGYDVIVRKPGTKIGTDTEMKFARIVTPTQKEKEKAHAAYVSMSVKLLASKKAI